MHDPVALVERFCFLLWFERALFTSRLESDLIFILGVEGLSLRV